MVQAYDNQEEMNCNSKEIDIEVMKQGYMEMAMINRNISNEDMSTYTKKKDTLEYYENFLK